MIELLRIVDEEQRKRILAEQKAGGLRSAIARLEAKIARLEATLAQMKADAAERKT